MGRLRIDQTELTRARNASGIRTDRELAVKLGLDPSTVSRVLSGNAEPGPRFLTAALENLPTDFDSLFFIEPDVAKAVSA